MRTFKTLLIGLIAGAAGLALADTPFNADQSFGATMPADPAPVSLRAAIAGLESGASKQVKIAGQITEVCQAKGCWMILMDGDTYARITFKDYGFFVPIETSMQRGVVYGEL
ncbi:MAG: DUF4920 domain-containing protein, partial [Pseudohongiellaceae bacterium]